MPNHRISPDDFIKKCKEKHGDVYDYSKTFYTTSRDFITITCRLHGDFVQQANVHLSKGCGCPKCKLGIRKTTSDFVAQASFVHKGKYSYENVVYVNKQTPVCITCATHGSFWQRPNDHLSGSNCPSCVEYGFNPSKPSTVYLLVADSLLKVGITNREVDKRVKQINKVLKDKGIAFEVLFTYKLSGVNARMVEKGFKSWAVSLYNQPIEKFDRYSETFVGVDYKLALSKIFEIIERYE